MTKETITSLSKWATRNAKLEFERDVLILRARQDGENMSEVARVAGLSRTHVYRVANEAQAYFDLVVYDLGSPEAAWKAIEGASSWKQILA